MKLIIKETFIAIKRSFKRFISILLIVLLGVGFFAGIKATSPDMKRTINEYYKDTKFQDIELLSTWGVTEEEINTLNKKGYMAEGYYSFDAIIKTDIEEAVKVLSYNKEKQLNKLNLVSGKLPEKENECVIDAKNNHNHKIGDIINIQSDNLTIKELEIVGIVKSPIYTSLERGTTELLTGTINYFIYVLEDNFNIKYYTNVGVYLDKEMYSEEYTEKLSKVKEELEVLTKEFKEDRYLFEKNKALEEYNNALNSFEKEKKSTLNKINNAKKEIEKARKEYNSGLKKLESQKTSFYNDYNRTLEEIEANRVYINDSLNKLSSSKEFLENEIINLEENLFLINEQIKNETVEENLISLSNQKNI